MEELTKLRRENVDLRNQLAPGGVLAQQLQVASDCIEELIQEKAHEKALRDKAEREKAALQVRACSRLHSAIVWQTENEGALSTVAERV